MKFKNLLFTLCFTVLIPARAATNFPARIYPSGAEIVIKIGNDLYTTLDSGFKKGLNPAPISLEQLETPVMAPVLGCQCSAPGQVSVSTGFIDLLNHIAHAKAIDRVQPGYFSQYISDLAQENAGLIPPPPRHLDNARYWKDDVMVEQTSLFNQMIGLTVAMNLSHHYLAHCRKYGVRVPAGGQNAINNFLNADEWAASVQCGALNSLDCALATAGGKALFEMIDHMPKRPAWAACLVPQGVNITTLNQRLSQYEREYFRGGLKAPRGALSLSLASAPSGAN